MKKLILPVFAVLAFIIAACNLEGNDPDKYKDAILAEYDKVISKRDSLEIILNDDYLDEVACDGAFKDAIETTDAAIKKLEELGAFKDDDTFQKAGLDFFKTIKGFYENEYKDLYELYKKPYEEWEDVDYDLLYELWDTIDYGIYDKEDVFIAKQKEFEEKNNINPE